MVNAYYLHKQHIALDKKKLMIIKYIKNLCDQFVPGILKDEKIESRLLWEKDAAGQPRIGVYRIEAKIWKEERRLAKELKEQVHLLESTHQEQLALIEKETKSSK